MDLYDAASYHALVLRTEGKSDKTAHNYLAYEKRFLAFLDARNQPATLESLSPVNVRQCVLWLQKQATGTRGGEVAVKQFVIVMKVWAGFLYREGVIPANWLDTLRPPKIREVQRVPYTRAELLALLEATNTTDWPTRDRLLVYLLLDTGARISEATTLTLPRIRLQPPERSITVLGKGNRERLIPIGDPQQQDGGPLIRQMRVYLKERQERLDRYRRETDRLLLTRFAYALNKHGAEQIVARLGAIAGVEHCIPHRFRHTAATLWLTKYPGDETGLRRLLGHISADMMTVYVHLSQQEMGRRAGQASPSSWWLRGA